MLNICVPEAQGFQLLEDEQGCGVFLIEITHHAAGFQRASKVIQGRPVFECVSLSYREDIIGNDKLLIESYRLCKDCQFQYARYADRLRPLEHVRQWFQQERHRLLPCLRCDRILSGSQS